MAHEEEGMMLDGEASSWGGGETGHGEMGKVVDGEAGTSGMEGGWAMSVLLGGGGGAGDMCRLLRGNIFHDKSDNLSKPTDHDSKLLQQCLSRIGLHWREGCHTIESPWQRDAMSYTGPPDQRQGVSCRHTNGALSGDVAHPSPACAFLGIAIKRPHGNDQYQQTLM